MAGGKRRSGRKGKLPFHLTEEEKAQLAQAEKVEGIEREIALLRVLINKALKDERNLGVKEARLQIETLCKALRLQHLLSGASEQQMSESLARVLDEMAARLGPEP